MMVCQTCGATAAAGSYCGECGGTLADSGGDELVGSQVGPYKLAKVLGEGGMGRVYLGVHPSIGSRVAVKVLSASCAEKPDLVDRFFAEAKAVNLIRHESIVNVLDLSKLPDGRPFIVMEYLDGAPLSSILLRGPLPLGSALRLATEVLGALSAAHAKGIVHRDLKPDNIFVSPQGRAKVLDFGIAKLLPEIAGSATPTQTGALLGTPHYMSPEQALAKRIDHRADIYAMGLILFECVTGQGAFNGESLYELLHRQVHEPPPYPKSLRPDLPDAYQDIILAALVKEPERRLPNAEEFIRRLGEISKSLTGDAWAPIGTRVDAASQQMAVMATPSGSGSRPGARPGEPLQPMQRALSHAPTMGATGAPTRDRVPPVKRKSSRMPIILAVLVALGAAGATAAVLAMGGGDDETTASAAGSADSEDEDSGDETDKGDSSDDSSDEVDKVAAAGDSDDGKSKSSANDGAKLKAEAEDSKSGSKAKAEADKAKAKAKAEAKAEAEAAAKAEADEAKAEAEAAKAKGKAFKPKIERFNIAVPNKRDFDMIRYLPQAQMQARRILPDAYFYRLDAKGVKSNGRLDLLKSPKHYVTYRFFSPRAHKRPASLAPGLDWEPKCVVYVNVTPGRSDVYLTSICSKKGERRQPRPRCTPKKMWDKAIKQGAPANGFAEYNYYPFGGGMARTYFEIPGTKFDFRGCH